MPNVYSLVCVATCPCPVLPLAMNSPRNSSGGYKSANLRCLFIFNKAEECIFNIDWQKEQYGKSFTLGSIADCAKHFISCITCAKVVTGDLAPKGPGARPGTFHAIRTDTYKLHLLETATGYRFVLVTDPNTRALDGQHILEYIYGTPFVEFVAKDPRYRHEQGQPVIDSTSFVKSIRDLPVFLKQ